MYSAKLNRIIMVGTALLIGLTLAQKPWLWAASLNQQAGLAWLPLFLPLLLLSLGIVQNRISQDDQLNLTASWIGALRWAILLPIMISWLHLTAANLLCMVIAAVSLGLFWTLMLSPCYRSAVWYQMDEPLLDGFFRIDNNKSIGYALSIMAAGWSRLLGVGISPAISGYVLVAGGGRPMWAAGIGALAAWGYRNYFTAQSNLHLASFLRSQHLVVLALPLLCWLLQAGFRYYAHPRQLTFDFERDRKIVLVAVVLLLLSAGVFKFEIGYLLIISAITFFYAAVAKTSIGLLLFPAWTFLELVPKDKWLLLTLGLLAGISGAVFASELRRTRRRLFVVGPSFAWVCCFIALAVGVMVSATPQLGADLATFPSASGDWLSWLQTTEFQPLLWVVFIFFLSIGILCERQVYIYLAWGMLMPVGWGLSMALGSCLAHLFGQRRNELISSGKGLVVGDIMASLLLLIS